MQHDGTRGASSSESMGFARDDEQLHESIERAAWSVFYQWPGVFDAEDMIQDLWEWYLESPAVQQGIEDADYDTRHKRLVHQGHNIASERRERGYLASGLIAYSVDDVKLLLKGRSDDTHGYEVLGAAMSNLRRVKPQYADLIEYRLQKGRSPLTDQERWRMKHAYTALADEMNREARRRSETAVDNPGPGESLGDGPGTRRIVLSESMLRILDEDYENARIEREWDKAKERLAGRRQVDRPKPPEMPHLSFAAMQKRDPLYPFNNRY